MCNSVHMGRGSASRSCLQGGVCIQGVGQIHGILRDMVNKRAVRILLECFSYCSRVSNSNFTIVCTVHFLKKIVNRLSLSIHIFDFVLRLQLDLYIFGIICM